MDLIKASNLRASSLVPFSSLLTASNFYSPRKSSFSFCPSPSPFHNISRNSLILHAKKRKSESEPVLEPTILEQVLQDNEEDDELLDEFEYGDDIDIDEGDDYYEDENEIDDSELYVGDGGGGGGISLAGTWWDKKALAIAEEVTESFDGDLGIYAFKTLLNSAIQVRIEKLSNKSGSPSMEDIEAFSTAYRARLDEAELAKLVPDNLSLEVSSPGVERIVRIPQDLERFKERAMYVKYVSDSAANDNDPSAEADGVFRLVSYDMETKCCTWGLADVRVNREKAGKGRPLSKKQREWRLNTDFDSLRLVRLYSDV
ncbi:hypothetical protein L6164_016282 [Bauhinia variegata]|uniref:Uncharacterized protein n=1 Tax=Bauhinia variegata TaxID=167791 RepID=A0ACB9NN93_BAUVA|nr:hypothetical protein L6164_016282 [Bauhinia variegata]